MGGRRRRRGRCGTLRTRTAAREQASGRPSRGGWGVCNAELKIMALDAGRASGRPPDALQEIAVQLPAEAPFKPLLPSHPLLRTFQHYRAAVYWDDAELARELVVRPAPLDEEDDWHWSGEAGVVSAGPDAAAPQPASASRLARFMTPAEEGGL